MKSWIHEISESYISTHKPVRRDLKENYVSLNEEQRFGLLSENVLNYLDEQLQNAYGFGVNDLTEEQLNELLGVLRNAGRKVADTTKRVAKGAALAGALAGGAASGSQHHSILPPEGAPVIRVTDKGGFKRVGSVNSDGLVTNEKGEVVQRPDGKGNAVADRLADESGTPENSDGTPQLHGGMLPKGAAVQGHDSDTKNVVKTLNRTRNRVLGLFNPFRREVVSQAGGVSQMQPRIYNANQYTYAQQK